MRVFPLIACLFISACADTYIDKAETAAPISETGDLSTVAKDARHLSREYVKAARSTRTVQDVLSSVVFVSAAATVAGSVGTASNTVLAERAAPGAAATVAGRRLVPKASIEAMYKGARRLNCVAVTADMAGALGFSDGSDQAALAATIGAVDHIKILTRESIVREMADFSDLFGELKGEIESAFRTRDGRSVAVADAERARGFDLNQYLQLLNNCLSSTAEPPKKTGP
ncbi:MAG: hypothetical protein ACKO2N_14780 [Tabrizicola sp.]